MFVSVICYVYKRHKVYMDQPREFLGPNVPAHVYKRRKSLYWLKQSPRAWFTCLSNHLLGLGFNGSKNGSLLFIWHHGQQTLLILVYINDINLTGPHQLNAEMHYLCHDFPIKDLGPLHYCLGVKVIKIGPNLHLLQIKYIRDLLLRSKMDGVKPCHTPIASKNTLSKHKNTLSKHLGSPLSDGSEYKGIVGLCVPSNICH